MLTSLGIVFLAGMLAAYVCKKWRLPGLLGMLIVGMAVGPYGADWLDGHILLISADLRQLALVIILTRVGLALDVADLKRVGRPAFLMCWLPATFEIVAIVILAPLLLKVSWVEAAVIGTVVAAVSPAVIVPRMLHLMDTGYGREQRIPQLIMAGASVDDVFVIVLFSSFVGLAAGHGGDWGALALVPVAIAAGIVGGMAVGYGAEKWFGRFEMRDSAKVLVLLSLAFLLVALERTQWLPFSGLLAVMCMGLMLLRRNEALAKRLSAKFGKLWVAAEVLLFVLVGATVDIRYAVGAGGWIILLVLGALVLRMAGVGCCLWGTSLNAGERLFCMIAYVPKATVQAAIGAVPLGMGLACGQTVLTVAVISILLTAPLGAVGIDNTYRRLLKRG